MSEEPHTIFQNGNRILLAVAALPILAAILLGLALCSTRGTSEFHPLEIRPPIVGPLRIASRTEGVDGPALKLSDRLLIAPSGSRTCNTLDHAVAEGITATFTSLDRQFYQVPLSEPIVRQVEPGCVVPTMSFGIVLPLDVTPGRWTLTISIAVTEDGREQRLGFVTEPFQVVP